MTSYRELTLALRHLKIDKSQPVIAHASLSAFGYLMGGAETVVASLCQQFKTILMPSFTYKTMLIPESGPENNACKYGNLSELNEMSKFFHPDMPADPLMGIIPETFRKQAGVSRSMHPILSFVGINATEILETQIAGRPLAPIAKLVELDGWVLLMGVGHKANTSIHLGERLAGRKTFLRWALLPNRVVESPGFPSCSDGFESISEIIDPFVRKTIVGKTEIQAIPVRKLIETTKNLVMEYPLALLCDNFYCERCKAVRDAVGNQKQRNIGFDKFE